MGLDRFYGRHFTPGEHRLRSLPGEPPDEGSCEGSAGRPCKGSQAEWPGTQSDNLPGGVKCSTSVNRSPARHWILVRKR